MKISSLFKMAGYASATATLCLLQGCSTVRSQNNEAASYERPLPGSLEPEPIVLGEPKSSTATLSTHSAYETPTPTRHVSSAASTTTTPYMVKPGDTLSGIAYRYKLRWQDVQAVNPSVSPKGLRVGQTIRLPGKVDVAHPARALSSSSKTVQSASVVPAGGLEYTVKRGDSLSTIAHRHGLKADAIRKANNLTGDKIREGQKLKLPAAGTEGSAPVDAAVVPTPTPTPELVPAPLPELAPTNTLTPVPAPPTVPTSPTAPGITPIPPPPPTALPAATPPTTVAANYQTHTVKEGEDLYAVAIRWSVSPSELKALNNLTGSDLLPGTVLKIPAAPAP